MVDVQVRQNHAVEVLDPARLEIVDRFLPQRALLRLKIRPTGIDKHRIDGLAVLRFGDQRGIAVADVAEENFEHGFLLSGQVL